MRVCKFGGASLRDAAGFRQAARIVAAAPDRRVIVVSAPGKRGRQDEKITDLLYACHGAAAAGRAFSHIFDRVAQRFRDIASSLQLPVPDDALRFVYHGLREGRSAAWAASRGEYLCGALLSRYLRLPLLDAAQVIRFDASGVLLQEETLRLLTAALGDGRGAVLPGFYGADAAGGIHTFPRGGSDVTGALAAAALHAEVYENWKDVRGVYAADPALVPDARCVSDMTYRELRAYSRLGAGVLHEAAVAPVRQAGVRLNIRSSLDPAHPGTWVHASFGAPESAAVTGITGRTGLTLARLERIGKGAELARAALALSLPLERLALDEDTLCLTLRGGPQALSTLAEGAERSVLRERLAALSVVGEGLSRMDAAARLAAALSAAGAPLLSLHQPPAGLYITALIPQEAYPRAVGAAYDAFLRA